MPYFLSPKQLIVLLENIGFNLPSITSLETFASKKNELIPIEKHYCKIDDNLTQLLDVVLHSIKSKVSEMSIDDVKLFLSVMLQMSLDYYLQSKMDLIVECIGFLLIFCPFEDLSSCIEELKLESVSQMSKILNTMRLVNPSHAQLLAKTQIAKLLDCNLAQLEEAIEEKIGKNDFLDNEAPKLYKFFTLFKVSLPLMDRGFLLRVMEPIQSIERNIQTMSSFIKSQAKNAALDVVTIIRLVNYDKITRKQSYLSEFFQNK